MRSRRTIAKTSSKRALLVFGAASLLTTGALVEACGLDDTVSIQMAPNGSQPDATFGDGSDLTGDGAIGDGGLPLLPDGAIDPGDDAAVALDGGDASFPDATASDGGACPAGQSKCGDGAASTCVTDCTAQCTGFPLSCVGGSSPLAACVADCTTCGGNSAQCFRCELSTLFAPSGTCENPSGSTSCIQDSNYLHCACFGYDVGNCPGATQVCRPTLTPFVGVCKTCGESNSSDHTCRVGGTCDTATDTCH